jgi:hypothetical protein
MRFRSLQRCTRAAVRVLFRVVSGFLFGFLYILFVYLEALCAFFDIIL